MGNEYKFWSVKLDNFVTSQGPAPKRSPVLLTISGPKSYLRNQDNGCGIFWVSDNTRGTSWKLVKFTVTLNVASVTRQWTNVRSPTVNAACSRPRRIQVANSVPPTERKICTRNKSEEQQTGACEKTRESQRNNTIHSAWIRRKCSWAQREVDQVSCDDGSPSVKTPTQLACCRRHCVQLRSETEYESETCEINTDSASRNCSKHSS